MQKFIIIALIFCSSLIISSSAVGGWVKVENTNIDDPVYQRLISASLDSLSQKDSLFSSQGWHVNKILEVYKQIVSGINYKLHVELINSEQQTQEMEWVIFSQPWTNTLTLTKAVKLEPSSSSQEFIQKTKDQAAKDKIIGGYNNKPVDENDPMVQSAITTALNTLTSENGVLSEGKWTCTKIISVATQVVSGLNIKITGEFTNEDTNETKTIEFIVYEQPWTNTSKLTSYNVLSSSFTA